MANSITLLDRFKAIFAKDKHAYWWHRFTDEEKELRRMDAWQLAKVINDARVRNLAGEAEKLIVAEHMLNVRLVRLQNRAVLIAAVFSIIGAAIGALITSLIQQPQKVECVYQQPTNAHPENAATNSNIHIKKPIHPEPVKPQDGSYKNAHQAETKQTP